MYFVRVEYIMKYVWKIRWWPVFDKGIRYFVRVEYNIKQVSVGYSCRRMPSVIVYGVLLRRIARLSNSELCI